MYNALLKISSIKIVFLLLLLGCQNFAHAAEKFYVINIASSADKFAAKHLPKVDIKKSHRFYSVKLKTKNAIWNRLRLGFFTSKTEAIGYLKSVRKQYPDAFLGLVGQREVDYSTNTEIHGTVYPVEYLLLRTTDALLASAANLKLTPEKQHPYSKKHPLSQL